MRLGCLKLVKEILNVKLVVQEALELCYLNAEKKQITLEVISKLTTEQEEILSDRNRINQLIINFVGNAIKFQDHGVIKVIMSIFQGFLRLEVLDHGSGIK